MSCAELATVGALCMWAIACSESLPPATDAGDDNIVIVTPDAVAPGPDAGPRLLKHAGITLPQMNLAVVYLGDVDAGGAPNDDAILKWLIGSPYWLLLEEYGIENGSFVGSLRVPTSAVLSPSDLDANDLVDVMVLQQRIVAAIHGDADAGTSATIALTADAYLFFLPDGINVALGHRGSYTYQTCIDTSAFHGYDGREAYVILPPCPEGRSLYAASHELAETATDPQPYDGWVSDVDLPANGGEVADLCEEKVMQEGVIVTRLWSNQENACVP